jgi:hypothetical protein
MMMRGRPPQAAPVDDEDRAPYSHSFNPAPSNLPGGVHSDSERLLLQAFQRIAVALENQASVAARSLAEISIGQVEPGFMPAGNAATVLTIQPASSNLFLVKRVFFALPATATGALLLGTVQFPLPAQWGSFGTEILLQVSDVRTLTSSVAGALALVLMGEQRSPKGLLH